MSPQTPRPQLPAYPKPSMASTEDKESAGGMENKEAKAGAGPSLKEIREAIPKHCFKPSNMRSLSYMIRDLVLSIGLAVGAYRLSLYIDDWWARSAMWAAYTVAQGFVFTGIWVFAHECGHQALFTSQLVNDSLGFVLHSLLLVPYFSWKYSHGLHHRYTNHMEKDTVFTPNRESESKPLYEWLHRFEMAEDTPALNLVVLLMHQLLGFPGYLFLNVSAGIKSLQRSDRNTSKRQSHFDPASDAFTTKQHPWVLLSDLGLAAVIAGLYYMGTKIGSGNMVLLYAIPYLWVNHWIVAITYLHHTHPDAHHFEADRWNYRDGALATVDRDFGIVGKYLFHGIIEFHVIHHLFTRIPFYHAEEATNSISKVLGDRYLRVESPFLKDLWQTWVSCKYVQPSDQDSGVLKWHKD